MTEYWLISAPGDKTPQQTYMNLKGRMTGLSPVFQLNLPELKVGKLIKCDLILFYIVIKIRGFLQTEKAIVILCMYVCMYVYLLITKCSFQMHSFAQPS